MEKLLGILRTSNPEIDWETDDNLVSEGVLDSIEIIDIIMEIENQYSIEIGMDYLEAENFENIESIKRIVDKIMENH